MSLIDAECRGPSMTVTLTTSPWLSCSRSQPGKKLRLFCFPYAGGAAHIFRTWPQSLPQTVEVCPVHLPGRGNRLAEPLFHRLDPLVHAATQALLPLLNQPFAFFGHSMGAVVAFELARHLRNAHHIEPRHLFMSGRRAPQIIENESPTYNLERTEFLEELRRLNGTPVEVLEHPELIELMLPILRADFQVVETYEYEPDLPLNCPITAFGGLKDDRAKREFLEAWREQTNARFSLQMFPGDHFFLHSAQTLLLKVLSQELEYLTSND